MPDTPTYRLPYQASPDEPDGARLGRRLALAVEGELSRIDDTIATAQTDINAVQDDINNFVHNRPVFRGYKAGTTGIGSSDESGPSSFDIDFRVGGSWTDAGHSSMRVFPEAGYYVVTMAARWDGSGDPGAFQVTIRKNSTSSSDPTTGDLIGTGINASASDGRDRTTLATTTHFFAAGENVQMGLLQNTGSTVDVIGGNIYSTYMEMFLLRPA